MSDALTDMRLMSRALVLAQKGRYTAHPNPCVGAVLVRDGQIIGEGWHVRPGAPHAEIMALDMAREAAGATCYVTLEPCAHHGRTPPCCEALVAADVRKVVVATPDPNPLVSGRGLNYLRQHGIDVVTGLFVDEARALNRAFFQRMETGRPRVVVKLASTLDGATALTNADSYWITETAARHDVQRLRAQCDAIITGAGTVMADDPMLTVRSWPGGPPPETLSQPLRVVLDPQGRVPATAKIWRSGPVMRVTANHTGDDGIPTETRFVRQGRVALLPLLEHLANTHQVNQVLVEAGATLAGAFLQANLVDELYVYQAAKIVGPAQRSLVDWPPLAKMTEAHALPAPEIRRVGRDWRLKFVLNP